MIKHVVIVAGGSPNDWPDLTPYLTNETAWIGVDRGTLYALQHHLPVEHAVGDFDSLTEDEWLYVSGHIQGIFRCASEKDDTDTQLGVLAAMERYPEAHYVLIGATGGRLDHFLSNLWLPFQERFFPVIERISILDHLNSIYYYLPGTYTIEKEEDKPYLAYVGLTEIKALSLYDAKYRLDKRDFRYPVSLSSNEFVGKTSTFSFDSGVMCVIQSKDGMKR
ncbi:MAG: thiamine diphosphokinase [Vagococcus sp.]